MSNFSFNYLRSKVLGILKGVVDGIDDYPVRSSYNKMIGGYTTTQKDISRTAYAAIKEINVISKGLYKKDVFTFKEDEDVNMEGSLADEE
tara:strand:- start:222 stop:491 length:270 start_codon:yes stop_codon:yes gene_type:complete